MAWLEIVVWWLAIGSIVSIICLNNKTVSKEYLEVVKNSNLHKASSNAAHFVAFLTLCFIWPWFAICTFRGK